MEENGVPKIAEAYDDDELETKFNLYFHNANSRLRRGIANLSYGQHPSKYHVYFVGTIVDGPESVGLSPAYLSRRIENIAKDLENSNADKLIYLGTMKVRNLVSIE
ncbi:hypothetical protein BNJ_00179 [Kaumoebavirus]|uniref:hypothetical protein n=1 Tax=Kaumoebavirus TaxID=1859492 RepID=UPI0009C24647|nr:hypothetical protein BNJ_00179 [Kaumoebavirus]ARA72010.1 hypothetical protein BNJ_00179 [Kaumoebavirus]